MTTQTTRTPFFMSKNGIVTLRSEVGRRIMYVDIGSGEPHMIDVTSLPMDALRGHAEAISLLVARAIEQTRAVARAQHGRDLHYAYATASSDD